MHWTALIVEQLIKDTGLTTAEIERRSGVSGATVHRWSNHGRTPHLDTLDRVLNTLGYRVSIQPIGIDPWKPQPSKSTLEQTGETSLDALFIARHRTAE